MKLPEWSEFMRNCRPITEAHGVAQQNKGKLELDNEASGFGAFH